LLKTVLVALLCSLSVAGAVAAQDTLAAAPDKPVAAQDKPVAAQDKPIKIALKATSTTPAAYLLQNLPAAGCSNVQIVTDESTADFLLEAQGGDFEGPGGSAGGHGPHPPRPKAHYTLYQNGAVVFGTTPIKEKSAVKDLCKFLQKPASK
jgi:hypothetical protein